MIKYNYLIDRYLESGRVTDHFLRNNGVLMKNTIEMNSKELAQPIIESLGYELVETEYKKLYGNPTLTFYIYRKGGITLTDCEKVSVAIGDVLEEHDVTMGAFYHLNVSSLGLDRPIITLDDFRRNLDEDVELIFNKEIGKMKKTHGVLISYDDDIVTIKEKTGKEVSYERKNLSMVRPYVSFK